MFCTIEQNTCYLSDQDNFSTEYFVKAYRVLNCMPFPFIANFKMFNGA